MYCGNCGKEVTEGQKFCTGCGMSKAPPVPPAGQAQPQQAYQNPQPIYQTQLQLQPQKVKLNPMVLAGFIVACVSLLINFWGIVGIVALVLSIIGYHQVAGTNEGGKGFALAGIIIGAFSVFYGFLVLMFGWTFLFF